MTHSGWRKPTPGLGRAEQLAQAGEQLDIPKSKAFVAVKRVGAEVGLKPSDMMLLDTLGAFTQPKDWEAGQRPIVWASNDYLMARTGFSLSALKRHARRLAEAGVIAFKDSPNGKRWGRRDGQGAIVEAYGFDLSPLAARTEEFEHLHDALNAERLLCQTLKRQITIARRMIREKLQIALSDALTGCWARLGERFESLIEQLPPRNAGSALLESLSEKFGKLLKQVEEAFFAGMDVTESVEKPLSRDEKATKMGPKGFENEPHIQTTNELKSVSSNSLEKQENASVQTESPPNRQLANGAKGELSIKIATILQACPEFSNWVRNLNGYVSNWREFHGIASKLCPMIGVSEAAWTRAQEQLGYRRASAAFALVFEKHCAGEVSSPGGYLRGMIVKAGAGELHLERSFYGRLNSGGA